MNVLFGHYETRDTPHPTLNENSYHSIKIDDKRLIISENPNKQRASILLSLLPEDKEYQNATERCTTTSLSFQRHLLILPKQHIHDSPVKPTHALHVLPSCFVVGDEPLLLQLYQEVPHLISLLCLQVGINQSAISSSIGLPPIAQHLKRIFSCLLKHSTLAQPLNENRVAIRIGQDRLIV